MQIVAPQGPPLPITQEILQASSRETDNGVEGPTLIFRKTICRKKRHSLLKSCGVL